MDKSGYVLLPIMVAAHKFFHLAVNDGFAS